MIKQLAHICIHSSNLNRTEAFYVEGLGMERFFDFNRDGQLFGFYLKAGTNTFIEVFKGEPGNPGNINHVALEVNDMEALLQRLRDQGFSHSEKKLGADQSWQAWLEDPDGVRIELHEYTAESSQLTGRTCVVDW